MQTRVFAFPSTLPVPPLRCCFFVFPFPMLCFAVALPAFPLLPSPSPPLLYQMQHFSVTDWRGMQQLPRWSWRGGRKRRKSCSQQKRQQKHWKMSFPPEVDSSHPLLGQQIKIRSLIQCVWRADPERSMYSYSVFSENKAQMYSSGSPQPGLNQQNGWLATPHTASRCMAKWQHNKNSLHCSQLKKNPGSSEMQRSWM